ncbi:Peptidase S54, rhomboid [Parasponia andersonii]|uniref:Peptidase S54, rhomboid n=1 Tax=Parasponia andersonii TaxID=3476 RepID=A0A2P5DBA2_PARAD|nr:Peptidase S54, rhomboid [Parasponia andersonii]
MQRLLGLRLASSLTRKLSDSTTNSCPYTSFSSITKRAQTQTQSQNHHHFLSHRPPYSSRPWRSQHTESAELHGFLSNPLLAKRLLDSSNTLLSAMKRGLADCRIGFLRSQYPRRGFELDPGFRSYQRSWRSWLRALTPNDMVLGLIIANVAVFLLWRVADYRFMMNNFTISVESFRRGRLHTLITSAFSHTDMEHIIHNMIGLYFFGNHLGQVFGSEFLLKLYLAGAVAGSVFYLVHSAFLASSSKGQPWKDPLRTPALGASGAVNAILLLDIFLYPTSTLYFNFFIPIPAVLLGIYLVGKDVLGMIEGDTPGSAHLGGAAVAALAWARLRKRSF